MDTGGRDNHLPKSGLSDATGDRLLLDITGIGRIEET
jgi:hypothetical protein